MSGNVIRAEGLGKKYHIARKKNTHRTLIETLSNAFASPFRRARTLLRGGSIGAADMDETLWALRDVSFQIRHGEAVGVIGRNGAGKSTLLKILSRITEPTQGYAEMRGRVGSLLEVGTGFHPDLSGRENIYLNGAILGMKKAEINRKFDEIVAFSEIEKFLDTPVKHYSSGMHVRLAFAVAAHLEPEILIVDEVLSVGDGRFQKKCLNKMQDVGQQGRTVLFVSHNMPAVTRLCERAILLEEGRVVADGPAPQAVNVYLTSELGVTAAREWSDAAKAPGREVARLRAVRVRGEDGEITDNVDIRKPVRVEMEYEVLKPSYVLLPNLDFFTQEGVLAFSAFDADPLWQRRPRPVGRYVSTVLIPGNFLSEGMMYVGAGCETVDQIFQFWERDAVAFQVVDSLDGDSARGDYGGRIRGIVRPLLTWSTQVSAAEDQATVTGLKEAAP